LHTCHHTLQSTITQPEREESNKKSKAKTDLAKLSNTNIDIKLTVDMNQNSINVDKNLKDN
jgi:hypothetical protein